MLIHILDLCPMVPCPKRQGKRDKRMKRRIGPGTPARIFNAHRRTFRERVTSSAESRYGAINPHLRILQWSRVEEKAPPTSLSFSVMRPVRVHSTGKPAPAARVRLQRCGLKDNADQNVGLVIAQRGIRLLLDGNIQKKAVRRCGIGKQKQRGQEARVKASGEEDKTQRPKRLRASLAKEEFFGRGTGKTHYSKSLVSLFFLVQCKVQLQDIDPGCPQKSQLWPCFIFVNHGANSI